MPYHHIMHTALMIFSMIVPLLLCLALVYFCGLFVYILYTWARNAVRILRGQAPPPWLRPPPPPLTPRQRRHMDVFNVVISVGCLVGIFRDLHQHGLRPVPWPAVFVFLGLWLVSTFLFCWARYYIRRKHGY